MKTKNLLLLILVCFVLGGNSISVHAQGFKLLKDVYPGAAGSQDYNNMAECNGKFFFSAEDGIHGMELWVSDGTDAGTHILKDIFPGPTPSEAGWANNFAVCNDKLFFIAGDDTHGYELWVTDGTEAGTTIVKDILPGGYHYDGLGSYSAPDQLHVYNGKVYFMANDGRPENGGHAGELWCSDGTEAGTYMIKDIRVNMNAETSFSTPKGFCEYNGLLYFNAYDGSVDEGGHGEALWVTDGTTNGTLLVTTKMANPFSLTVCNGKMYFTATDGIHGTELWITDGTKEGTHMVKDIRTGNFSGSSPTFLTVLNNVLYFKAYSASGSAIWKTDGTDAGTTVVYDPTLIRCYDPYYLKAYNGKLLFLASNESGGNNYELWGSDGTAEGTALVKEINPNPTSGMIWIITDFKGFVEYGNRIYFGADKNNTRNLLWETDGTEAGTNQVAGQESMVTTLGSDEFHFQVFDGSLYFPARFDMATGLEVFKFTASAPLAYTVTGSGSFCKDSEGLYVGLSGSETNVTYTLYKDNAAQVPTLKGTGEALSFGKQLSGTYTIAGVNVIGTIEMTGNAVLSEVVSLPVSVTMESDNDTVCGGSQVNFTAHPVNGGTPAYQWYKNDLPVGINQAKYTYNTSYDPAITTDHIYIVMTSDLSCGANSPATSNIETVTILPAVAVSLSIEADNNAVCDGNPVTFTATAENGGTPFYYWFVNDNYAGINESTYSYVPANGDRIYANMSSSLTCVTNSPAGSNTITITVNDPLTPKVSIVASTNPAEPGKSVTFTPTTENGGIPTYQWFVNGKAAGNGATYEYVPKAGDRVYSIMTSSLECVNSLQALSNIITLNLITGINNAEINGFKVYCYEKEVVIENSLGLTGEVSIYDLAGRRLITRNLVNETKTLIPVSSLTNGIYVVKVNSDTNQFSTKVLIN